MKFSTTSTVVFASFLLAGFSTTSAESTVETPAVRTDVVDKTILALKTSFVRAVRDCDEACREDRNVKLGDLELDQRSVSEEATDLVKKLMASKDFDVETVTSWIDRAGEIQRVYFNSVFQYFKDGAPKDAFFYLDIGNFGRLGIYTKCPSPSEEEHLESFLTE